MSEIPGPSSKGHGDADSRTIGPDMYDLQDITFVGTGLSRPECVLSHASGCLFVPDWTGSGGVSVVRPEGGVERILASTPGPELRPNGIALLPGGRFLIAHLGEEDGGVFRLDADGQVEPVVIAVDGAPLPPTNYVHRDAEGRLWITVSTRLRPRSLGYRADVADGFILLHDGRGSRIVADGLGYANECVVDPSGDRLFVNETFARRTVAFDIRGDGSLGRRAVIAEYGEGTYPDGLTFDAEGGVWITSIISNRVIRIGPDGRQEVIIEDCDPDHIDHVERAFGTGELGRPHLDAVRSKRLRNISSLAFGGPDRRTGYLGCLLGDAIACFRSPVAGHPPSHWDVDLGTLDRPPAPRRPLVQNGDNP